MAEKLAGSSAPGVTALPFSERRRILREARSAWRENCDGSVRDIARYRLRVAIQAKCIEALEREIACAREACPSIRMQDNFDAPLLVLVEKEVARGFRRDAEIDKARVRIEALTAENARIREAGDLLARSSHVNAEAVKALTADVARLTAERDTANAYGRSMHQKALDAKMLQDAAEQRAREAEGRDSD